MQKMILQVAGMSCGGCAAGVTRAVEALDGVHKVTVDLASGRVEVEYDGALPERELVVEAISDAGFEVVG